MIINRLLLLFQWLSQSPTRITGVIMLASAAFLLLFVITLASLPAKVSPSPIPQYTQNLPSPTPDPTVNWVALSNSNGFSIKYPPGSKILPSLAEATSSAYVSIATQSAAVIIEVTAKNNPQIAGQDLKAIVETLREKNASPSAKMPTKPVSIFIFRALGYVWLLESNKFSGFIREYPAAPGKNRVIQFIKENQHYLIFSGFSDLETQLLSTLRLLP